MNAASARRPRANRYSVAKARYRHRMDDDALALLTPGISGFGACLDPRWNASTFRAACHAAVRLAGRAALGECAAPHAGCNHYRAAIDHDGRALWLLLNAIVPLLGFARRGDDGRYRFVDAPALAAGFFGPHRLVGAVQLEARADPQELARRFSGHEREQARYWRPERVGDVVFNHWD